MRLLRDSFGYSLDIIDVGLNGIADSRCLSNGRESSFLSIKVVIESIDCAVESAGGSLNIDNLSDGEVGGCVDLVNTISESIAQFVLAIEDVCHAAAEITDGFVVLV